MTERTQQVKLMGELYRKTHRVLVWLGPDPNGSAPKVVDMLGSLRNIFTDSVLALDFRDPKKEYDPFPKEMWEALGELYQLPWVSS